MTAAKCHARQMQQGKKGPMPFSFFTRNRLHDFSLSVSIKSVPCSVQQKIKAAQSTGHRASRSMVI
ncbi:MAG: hypothetical protein ABSA46_14030 [Thermodesulfovibrionales bacterium]|jgi:hypothetical protein